MKIDYSKIIELGDKRRVALQNIAALLDEAKAMDSKLAEVQTWVDKVAVGYEALDTEGRLLLPQPVQIALTSLRYVRQHVSNARLDSSSGISMLICEDES